MRRSEVSESDIVLTVTPEEIQSAGLSEYDESQSDGIYVFPASLEQSRYWLLDQLAGASTASNMAVAFRLEGLLRDDLVEQCIRNLVLRHEALRTNFRMVDGVLSQIISERPEFVFTVSDLRAADAATRQQQAEELIHEHSRVRFDLATGALFYVHLIHVTDTDHFLAFTLHHIVCDGWSNGILVRDFALLYEAAVQGRAAEMPELPFQFADFTVWQQEWLESEAAGKALAYWKEHIQRDMPAIDLPSDAPRTAQKSAPGDIEGVLLPAALTTRLKTYCRQHDATMHQVLLAAFEAVISRYAGQSEFLLGSTIANRTQPGMENVIGRFAHPQVVLADVRGNPSYRELVKRVADWSAKSYAHQDLPFSRLTEEFQLDQAGATSQFLQVYFVYQKAFMQPQQAGELRIVPRPSVSGGVNFDMLVSIVERAEGPRLQIEYNTLLFRRDRIRRLLELYTRVLEAVMDDDTLTVEALPLLSSAEKSTLHDASAGQLLHTEPLTDASLPISITAAFDLQVEARANSSALVSGETRVSWRELQTKSLHFAHAMQGLGLRAGQTVAIRIETGADSATNSVSAALAVMRLGAIVLPIPASVSSAEWQSIQAEFEPSLSFASRSFAEKFSSVMAFEQLAHDPSAPVAAPDSLSYPAAIAPAWLGQATTKPEAGIGSHQSIAATHGETLRSLRGAAQALDLRPDTAVLVFPSHASTDAWVDLLLPLLSGATIVYAVDTTAHALQPLLDREQISFAFAASSDWTRLLAGGWTGDRRLNLVSRGSRLSSAVAEQLTQSPCRVWSLLSSAVTAGPFAVAALQSSHPGQWPVAPLPGESLHVLDDSGHSVPFAVPGELVVRRGSTDLRPGYHARYTPDLGFEVLDHVHRFVRLHGYRLRLGELEDLLPQEPSVATADVAIQPDASGKPVLVAYVTGRNGGHPSPAAVSAWLKSTAPPHLSSAEVIPVTSVPRRLDGSADVATLPAPGSSPLSLTEDPGFVPPRDELESSLIAIWESVLAVRGIGIRTNFFTLGGYSLMIVRLFANINRTLSIALPITTIFNAPTVEQLADIIRGRTLYSPLVPVQPRGTKPPFFLVHSYLLYGGLPSVLGEDYPFYGLREMDEHDQSMTMEQRVASYAKEIRSIQPHGPYYLGGWCAAGPLAVETARQLTNAGEDVRIVALFDSWRPGYAAELATQQKGMPDMALTAVLSRKYRFHRNKLRQLSPFGRVKYAFGAGRHKIGSMKNQLYLKNWALAHRLFTVFGLPLPHFMHNVSLETLQAVRSYNPPPFPGRITLIRATEAVYIPGAEPACGWGALATEGVEVLWAPGDHESMFVEPNLSVVGDTLRSCLEKAYLNEAPAEAASAEKAHASNA
jgi:non-ribosomal peptide synthetase component F/thioesterase domain-containing protein